jgi:hypothetical protein
MRIVCSERIDVGNALPNSPRCVEHGMQRDRRGRGRVSGLMTRLPCIAKVLHAGCSKCLS